MNLNKIYTIEIDEQNKTTTIRSNGYGTYTFPFIIDSTDFETPEKMAITILTIYSFGFSRGYEAADFDEEEQSYIASMGEDY